MSETFASGELFVYINGIRWELGVVKRANETGDGYFCWYSRSDTAANTPVDHMYKLANADYSHIENCVRHEYARLRKEHDELFAQNCELATRHAGQMDTMRRKLRAAQAENAKLRERVAELEELLPDSGRWYRAETVEAYVAEIDKLRKLVDYMAPIALYGASEQERDRMRELGVEVGE